MGEEEIKDVKEEKDEKPVEEFNLFKEVLSWIKILIILGTFCIITSLVLFAYSL